MIVPHSRFVQCKVNMAIIEFSRRSCWSQWLALSKAANNASVCDKTERIYIYKKKQNLYMHANTLLVDSIYYAGRFFVGDGAVE